MVAVSKAALFILFTGHLQIKQPYFPVSLSGCGCIVVVEWAFNHTHFAFICKIIFKAAKSLTSRELGAQYHNAMVCSSHRSYVHSLSLDFHYTHDANSEQKRA